MAAASTRSGVSEPPNGEDVGLFEPAQDLVARPARRRLVSDFRAVDTRAQLRYQPQIGVAARARRKRADRTAAPRAPVARGVAAGRR